MENKIEVYVGCALTNAPKEFRDFIAQFIKDLKEFEDVKVLEFLGLTAGTPREVYERDLHNARTCKVFVVFVDHPSIGIGMEIQEARHAGVRTIALSHVANVSKVTPMITGAAELGHLEFRQYTGLDRALEIIDEYLENLRAGSGNLVVVDQAVS